MKYLLSVFLILLTQLNDLVDVVVCTEVKGANVHLDIILQKVLGQTYTRAWSEVQFVKRVGPALF